MTTIDDLDDALDEAAAPCGFEQTMPSGQRVRCTEGAGHYGPHRSTVVLDAPLNVRVVPTLVVIESPFAGDVERNRAYLLDALRDSLRRGEAPFASHELYTRALDDAKPNEREAGIAAGLAWGARAELVAVYHDLGISAGMRHGIEAASGRTRIEFRSLPEWADGKRPAAKACPKCKHALRACNSDPDCLHCDGCDSTFPPGTIR